MVILIVVVAMAVLATAGVLVAKSVFGNFLDPYCRTAGSVSAQLEDLNTQLTTAASTFNMDEMSDIMGQMITLFEQMRDASPPDTVTPSLDTLLDYLTHVKDYIDSRNLWGYLAYSSQHSNQEIQDAVTTLQTASLEYCT